jgi:hypothetical protein
MKYAGRVPLPGSWNFGVVRSRFFNHVRRDDRDQARLLTARELSAAVRNAKSAIG